MLYALNIVPPPPLINQCLISGVFYFLSMSISIKILQQYTTVPPNKRRWPNVASMLARRLRRRPNIKQTLGKWFVFDGVHAMNVFFWGCWLIVDLPPPHSPGNANSLVKVCQRLTMIYLSLLSDNTQKTNWRFILTQNWLNAGPFSEMLDLNEKHG